MRIKNKLSRQHTNSLQQHLPNNLVQLNQQLLLLTNNLTMASFLINKTKSLVSQLQNEDNVVPVKEVLVDKSNDTSKQSTNLPLDEKSIKDGDDDTAEVTENTSYTGDSASLTEKQQPVWQKFCYNEEFNNNIQALTEIGSETFAVAKQNLEVSKKGLDATQANSKDLKEVKSMVAIMGEDKIKLQKQAAQSEKKLHKSEKKLQRSEQKNSALAEENSRLKARLFAARNEKENTMNRPRAAPKDGKQTSEVVKGYDKHTKNRDPGAGEEKAKAKAKEEGRFLH